MKKTYLNTLKAEEIIKRLKNGEIVRIDGICKNYYKMIDGILCCYYDNEPYSIGMRIDIKDDDYYFEEPEEFKVEKTGLYKTRDGRIAFVSSICEELEAYYLVCGIIKGSCSKETWTLNGRADINKELPMDLVEYVGD